jgi:3-oxoacyl-[acyl-carrier-protein] synthase III
LEHIGDHMVTERKTENDLGFGIQGAACFLPEHRKPVRELMAQSAVRLDQLRSEVISNPALRNLTDFGIKEVPVAESPDPWEMARPVIERLLSETKCPGSEIDALVDFSIVKHPRYQLIDRIKDMIGAVHARSLEMNSGGCAAFHLALREVKRLMTENRDIERILMFAGDIVPEQSRVCFPLTVLGDGASAVLLDRSSQQNRLTSLSIKTEESLADSIGVPTHRNVPVNVNMDIYENRLMPVFFKAVHDVMNSALTQAGITRNDVSRIIYPNMSIADRRGFMRAFHWPVEMLEPSPMESTGHVFASDMIINMVHLLESGVVSSGKTVLILSSGAGFHWGAATLRK